MPERGQAIRGKARDTASKTKARLALMAYTGFAPATIMRLRPQDVRWDAGAVFVPGRRKGKGTKGQTIPLASAGLAALRRFDQLDCWGPFSTSSAWRSFQRACAKLGLAGLRPYDLRHSFGTAVYAARVTCERPSSCWVMLPVPPLTDTPWRRCLSGSSWQ